MLSKEQENCIERKGKMLADLVDQLSKVMINAPFELSWEEKGHAISILAQVWKKSGEVTREKYFNTKKNKSKCPGGTHRVDMLVTLSRYGHGDICSHCGIREAMEGDFIKKESMELDDRGLE